MGKGYCILKLYNISRKCPTTEFHRQTVLFSGMISSYANIKATSGLYAAGICQIKMVPREWLTEAWTVDFLTGKVISEILLEDDREFITLDLVPDSYEFEEKPKSNRGGSYFEVMVQGTLNNITPELLATLETVRYHEMVAILKDKQRRYKVVGNKEAGLIFRYSNKEDSTKQGGLQVCAIDMAMDSDKLNPFYEI